MPMSQKKSENSSSLGILFLDKPEGITSFQSLGAVKKYFHTKKVGHTGTLDKFARGLMIVLVGKMTRLNPIFTGMDKTYEGVIRFGEETDTLDPEGEICHRASVPSLSLLEERLTQFLGPIEQVPPLYSAIHVNGKRSWRLARQGVEVEMKPRKVRIDLFEILDWNKPDLTVRVACSSGTYIRSLARDLALSCGSRAHLSALKRTRVGDFTLHEARSPHDNNLDEGLYSLHSLLERLPFQGSMILSDEESSRVKLGIPPMTFLKEKNISEAGLYPLFNRDFSLAALLELKDEELKYRFVM
jgi:tRNA pseudouridine55 synthase